MLSGRRTPLVLTVLASIGLAGCTNLPDPAYQGKAHKEDERQLSRPEILADILSRVARNAEKSKDYETAQMFYTRAHGLDKKKIEPLLGMGRTLAAMNAPLESSEAYGAALALDENNKEAEVGLAKSLDLLAMKSGRNPPSNIPPAPPEKMAMAEPPAMDTMRDTGGDMPKASPPSGEVAMIMEGKTPGEIEVTDADFGGTSQTTESKFVENDTGANEKASRVKLNDVLAAIEWKDNQPGAASRDMKAEEGKMVASAGPGTGAMGATDPVMSEAAKSAAAPTAHMATSYRLQLAAFSSQSSAQSARVKVFDKADAVLEDVSLVIEQGVSGAGKPVYKLRTGPVGDRAAASALCAKLKQRSVDCFLVVPKGMKSTAMKAKSRRPMMAKSMPAKAPAMQMNRATQPAPMPTPMMDKTAAAKPAPMTGGTKGSKPKENSVIRWEVVNTTEEGGADKDAEADDEVKTAEKDDDDPAEAADTEVEKKDTDPADAEQLDEQDEQQEN